MILYLQEDVQLVDVVAEGGGGHGLLVFGHSGQVWPWMLPGEGGVVLTTCLLCHGVDGGGGGGDSPLYARLELHQQTVQVRHLAQVHGGPEGKRDLSQGTWLSLFTVQVADGFYSQY